MELIYIYIDSYRNYKNAEIPLSDKFDVCYDSTNNKILINKRNNYFNLYPPHISNINAIVGKNSVGKTNLMDLIGMKIDDRNKGNAECTAIFKKDPEIIFKNKLIKEIKHAKYFLIYYLGNYDNEDIYCFEGNFISEFNKLIANEIINESYFESKMWFSFICTYKNQKLNFICSLNNWDKYYSSPNVKDEYVNPCVISFRNNYNSNIYDYISLKPSDDYKISIPRRIAKMQPNLWLPKIEFLVNMMKSINGTMYKNKEYLFSIKYHESLYTEEKPFSDIYNGFTKAEKNKGKIIEAFLCYTYYQINNSDEKRNANSKKFKSIIYNGKSYYEAIAYYGELFSLIINTLDTKLNNNEHDYAVSRFNDFIKALDNQYIDIDGNKINIKITIDSKISDFENVIKTIIDDDYLYSINGEFFTLFTNFFVCSINNLSDGELSHLGLFSSIDEQLRDDNFCKNKNKFVILLDEPETKMHPDLSRSFINDLIVFLDNYKDKTFQIIISTHSPFILSDILPGNIQMLHKDNNGYCKIEPCIFSTFSANIHDILSNNFFMSSTMGAYSRTILENIIKVLTSHADPKDFGLSKNDIAYIISIIGEPIIKRKLSDLFDEKYGQSDQRRKLSVLIDKISDPLSDISMLKDEIIDLLNHFESSDNDE